MLRFVNFKGELFATTFSFAATGLIKLVSSAVLTRLLFPEAYGIVTLITSIAFMIELLSDVGVAGLTVRHERGDEPNFYQTMWTVRLIRSWINFVLIYACAPLIARLYDSPALTEALRIFSFSFLIQGLESVSFLLARRHKKARIVNYTELATTAVSTVFVIVVAHFQRDHLAMIYGMLLQRLLMSAASYAFYRDIDVKWKLDRTAARALFDFAKYVTPSSVLTIVLTQYDKVIFLRLFDLQLLGLYGLALNVIGPINGLINKNSRMVLYPRVAENFRRNRDVVADRYYRDNTRLFYVNMTMPAVVAGASQLIVDVLFDPRYAGAGLILQVMAIRAGLHALAIPAESLLVASGRTSVMLQNNLLRVFTIIPGSLIGYWLFGFEGFLWGATAGGAAVLVFLWEVQRRARLFRLRHEATRVAFMAGVAIASWVVSALLLRSFGHVF